MAPTIGFREGYTLRVIPESASISEDEAKAILAQTKEIVGDVEWQNLPKNSAFYKANFVVYDERDATVPGLTIELSYRHSAVPGDCNHKFTIFKLKGSRRLRAYQIEVYPPTRQSHKTEDGKAMFGPHQHIGEKYEPIDGAAELTCEEHEGWMREFFRRGNIKFSGHYSPPGPHAGQMDLGI